MTGSKILCVLAAFLLTTIPAHAINNWTVALYCAAETGRSDALREEAVVRQLMQIEKAGIANGCEFIVQMEMAHKTSEFLAEFYKKHNLKNEQRTIRLKLVDGKWSRVTSWSTNINMGSPGALDSFLNWMRSSHRARHYFVILSGWGDGLFAQQGTGGYESKEPGAVDFNSSFVAYDKNYDDVLTIFEIQKVFAKFKTKYNRGRKLDIVAFDTRFAGSLEALYEFKDTAQIAIASPLDDMVTRFDYSAPARLLVEEPRVFPEQLADRVARAFIDKPENAKGGDAVVAAWRLSELAEIGAAVDALALEMLRGVARSNEKYDGKHYRYDYDESDKHKKYWDLYNFCDHIQNGRVKPTGDKLPENFSEIKKAARYVKDAIEAANITLFRNESAKTKNKLGGLNIVMGDHDEYFPSAWKNKGFRQFYSATRFAQDFNWDRLIDHQMGVAENGPIHDGF
mgnify:CR=1 FL=1